MDNYEIALEQQGGNDYSTPVGTHFTVRLEDKASFGRVLYEGSKIVGVPFMIATVLEPAVEATETIFAQKEFMDKREVVAWHPRIAALRTLFELHGSYARARQNKIGKGLGADLV